MNYAVYRNMLCVHPSKGRYSPIERGGEEGQRDLHVAEEEEEHELDAVVVLAEERQAHGRACGEKKGGREEGRKRGGRKEEGEL